MMILQKVLKQDSAQNARYLPAGRQVQGARFSRNEAYLAYVAVTKKSQQRSRWGIFSGIRYEYEKEKKPGIFYRRRPRGPGSDYCQRTEMHTKCRSCPSLCSGAGGFPCCEDQENYRADANRFQKELPCVTGCRWTTDGFSGYLWKKLPILDKIAYLIETPAKPGILCLGPESIFIDIIL